jgi:hypothetical protein
LAVLNVVLDEPEHPLELFKLTLFTVLRGAPYQLKSEGADLWITQRSKDLIIDELQPIGYRVDVVHRRFPEGCSSTCHIMARVIG